MTTPRKCAAGIIALLAVLGVLSAAVLYHRAHTAPATPAAPAMPHGAPAVGTPAAEPVAPAAPSSFRFRVEFPAEFPLNGTRVLSAAPLPHYPSPPAAAVYDICAAAGSITADISGAGSATCTAEVLGSIRRRQPSGAEHTLHYLLLAYETTAEDGSPCIYLQQLEVDPTARTADPVACITTPPRYRHLTAQDYHTLTSGAMPEKHGGSPIQRRMSMLLHATAAINSPQMAAAAAPELRGFAARLIHEAPHPAAPWPDCWGEHAPDARSAAARITPTLLYLRANNCFDSEELASFLNSPDFGKIFGDRFTAHSNEHLQDTPILYTPIPEATTD